VIIRIGGQLSGQIERVAIAVILVWYVWVLYGFGRSAELAEGQVELVWGVLHPLSRIIS
jgi:hypothetical protein